MRTITNPWAPSPLVPEISNEDSLVGIDQRAKDHRLKSNAQSEDVALALGGLNAQMQRQMSNHRAGAMAQNNPGWDQFFQAIDESAGGKAAKIGDNAQENVFSNPDPNVGISPVKMSPVDLTAMVHGLKKATKGR